MSEHNPADMGGGEEAGPIEHRRPRHEVLEKQANALPNTLSRHRIVRLDEMRRAAEELGSRSYELSYFQRITEALRNLLLEKGFFARAELERKIAYATVMTNAQTKAIAYLMFVSSS